MLNLSSHCQIIAFMLSLKMGKKVSSTLSPTWTKVSCVNFGMYTTLVKLVFCSAQ